MGDSGTPSAFTKPDTPEAAFRWELWGLVVRWEWMWWPCMAITTGCTCRDMPRWYPGRPAHPACPVHSHQPTPAAVPPCTCRYGLFYVAGVVPSHALDPYANGWRRGVYAFRINAWCPHHGYAAADRLVDLVLDEDERRGH